MCDMPLKSFAYQKHGEKEFSTEQFKNVIKQFALLGTPGIGFTGGEPLLRDDIFELMAETRRRGMIAHLNTNGWLLDDNAAQKLIDIGVDSVNISLDGATAETHDKIRNCNGSFERATQAVKRLIALKKRYNSKIRIKTVAVLDESNIDEILALLRLGKELETDCIELIPRQPFAEINRNQKNEEELIAKVDHIVEILLKKEYDGVILENSQRHLKLFHDSFAGKPSPLRCRAGYNSLAVDCYGNLFPCVPWINWGKTSGMMADSTLSKVWHSPEYQKQREITSNCRDCYLNCQAEMNILFDV